MKLKKNEFEVMVFLEENIEKTNQRIISENIRISLGSTNEAIKKLKEQSYITKEYKLTEKGLLALEPYKVKRAILLAAGFGSRLAPVTLKTPKPLIKICGTRLIEPTLRRLTEIGIKDVTIVTGYKSEQFNILLEEFPHLKIIKNDLYSECNNISSAYPVRSIIGGSYVLDSDLLIKNKRILRKYEYQFSCTGRFVKKTDDWVIVVKNGRVKGMKQGAENQYLMYGLTYVDEISGKRLATDLEQVFNSMPGGKEKYWDQIHLEIYNKFYDIGLKEVIEEDIIEIDTFNELVENDPFYAKYK